MGDRLPADIRAIGLPQSDEVVLWLARTGAIVSGDALLGGARKPLRVCPPSWLPTGVARAEVATALTPLLELPIELVVPLHGEPITDRAREVLGEALAEALA